MATASGTTAATAHSSARPRSSLSNPSSKFMEKYPQPLKFEITDSGNATANATSKIPVKTMSSSSFSALVSESAITAIGKAAAVQAEITLSLCNADQRELSTKQKKIDAQNNSEAKNAGRFFIWVF